MKKIFKLLFFALLSLFIFSISFSADDYQKDMLSLVNIERKNENLSPLVLDEKLNEIAKDKVKLLIKEGKLNHLAGGYKSFGEFLKSYNVDFVTAGENIAKKTQTNEETMNLWLNSKGHRANIMNENFTNIGIAKDSDKNGDIYWVQIFIKPKK